MNQRSLVGLCAALAASCGSPTHRTGIPHVRFTNADVVTAVDDRRDTPRVPQKNRDLDYFDYYTRAVEAPIQRQFKLPVEHVSLGVNALDEVPDSTWFTNRIGVTALTPEAIRIGPGDDDGPMPHKPWTIFHGKIGGSEPGLVVRDARGTKYLIKWDTLDAPELMTGTQVVVNRLLWASGYNVPVDDVAYIRPEEFEIAPSAKIEVNGHTVALDREELDRRLEHAWRDADGRIRVLASRWLDGEPLGGTPIEGTRKGDPNDVIPHERRRDLRGQFPIFAWLDHVDLPRSNFLDMYVADREDPRKHYVVHYRIDFDKSFGVMAVTDRYLRTGWAYAFDWGNMGSSLIRLGIPQPPWGKHFAPELVGVSPVFTAAGFDPGKWKANVPYQPFLEAEPADMYWGAKIVGRFTRDQIRAAVEAAHFTDPRTTEYLTETLVKRQRATIAYWYERVNPLDRSAVTPDGLCFADLGIEAGLADPTATRYDLAAFDVQTRPLGRGVTIAAEAGGSQCTRALGVSTASDAYTIVKVTTRRGSFAKSTYVYVARDPTGGELRVIGIVRD